MHNSRTEFPLKEGITYLNHAAVSPWPLRTAEAVKRFAEDNLYRGSQGFPHWLEVEAELRERLRWLINAPSADDIAILKSTSEGLSVVAHGLAWVSGDNIVIPDQEFPSNRVVWESLEPMGVEVRQVDLTAGDTPEAALMARIDGRTRLVSVSAIQYATGLRMDLATLGQFCRQNDILFCVDAIQALGAVPFDVQAIQADFVMADGHKWMLSPEGIALFYCNPALRERLKLHQYGWHMVEHHGDFDRREWQPAASARRFECGSPNMLGIHALHASLSLFQEIGIESISRKIINNASYLIDKIQQNESLSLITPERDGRYAGIVTFRYSGADAGKLYRHLMDHGVMCALRAGGIRFSPHFYNHHTDLDRAVGLVNKFR